MCIKFLKKSKTKLSQVLLFILALLNIIQVSYADTVFESIANQYLPSISKPSLTKEEISSVILANGRIDREKVRSILNKKTESFNRKKIVFDLFTENQLNKKNIDNAKCIMGQDLWIDTELFRGQHNGEKSILNIIKKTRTDCGMAMLAKLLAKLIINIPKLNKRQAIIKELINNEELFKKIDNILKYFQKVEAGLLSFWDEKVSFDIFGSESYYPFFPINRFPRFLQKKMFPDDLKNKLNQNPTALNALTLWNLCLTYDSLRGESRRILLDFKQTKRDWKIFNIKKEELKKNWAKLSPLGKTKSIYDLFSASRMGSFDAGHMLLSIFYIKRTIETEIDKVKALKLAHEKLKQAAMSINCLIDTKELIDKNSVLKENFTCLDTVKYLFDGSSSQNKEFDNLLNQLKSSTFKHNGSQALALLISRGKILSSAFLMLKNQDNLTDILQVLGELDAYMSIAKLYKENENNENAKYCFAKYIEQDTPYISLKKSWTPFINPETVITNDIELGKTNRNMLISGPNAGGKSTILKAIIVNLLLAQTLGITPCQEIIFTPFSYLDTYLNITDDISSGNSLFKSEVLRVKALLETIKDMEKTKFSFVVMDEIFSGTNPKEGQAAGYAIGKYLSSIDNNISIIASHFPLLTKLEIDTNGIFKNGKVCVTKNPDNSLNYPFKLEMGITDQTIAIEILRNQNFDKQIIDDAYNAING
ncbi:hypothetical protein K9M16_04505 [Candidatus Babeliales bacterium]|nr:hypothetical protein [Candidatus Babeliales bacterium]